MSSPISMIVLIAAYLYVIRNGKKFMEHRKPYNIERLIIGYNILQIIINSVVFLLVGSINQSSCVCACVCVFGATTSLFVLFRVSRKTTNTQKYHTQKTHIHSILIDWWPTTHESFSVNLFPTIPLSISFSFVSLPPLCRARSTAAQSRTGDATHFFRRPLL